MTSIQIRTKMPESFLILLAGGVMLAAAISDPRQVTVRWLRLAGILALCFAALALVFPGGRHVAVVIVITSILAQLGLVQVLWLRAQRAAAGTAFILAVVVATILSGNTSNATADTALTVLAYSGVASGCGLVLMDMLLGHAYLTASKMTIAPFRRLNLALAGVLGARIILSIGAIILLSWHPIELFWARFGLYVATRWFIGLVVPAVFVFMAHDCIKRRSTQSATGILYVTGVLIFIGELIALYLTRETGLPL